MHSETTGTVYIYHNDRLVHQFRYTLKKKGERRKKIEDFINDAKQYKGKIEIIIKPDEL